MAGNSQDPPFVSELSTGAEKFLSQAIAHAHREGWRSPEDFIRHFGPQDIMQALETATDLRARLLVLGAGVHEKIARKKSTMSAAEDLRIALDEEITTPADILELFPPDERVRYLDNQRLWTFLIEGEFWTDSSGKKDRAVDRLTFTLENALKEGLITLQDLSDGIGFSEIAKRLPRPDLERVVTHALSTGRRLAPLNEESLLSVVPLRDLVFHVPLTHTWEKVVVAKVAVPTGLSGSTTAEPPKGPAGKDSKASSAKAVEAKSETKPKAQPQTAAAPIPEEKPKPGANGASAAAETALDLPELAALDFSEKVSADPPAIETGEWATDSDVDDLLESTRSPQEEEARSKVIARLKGIERLPPKHADLTTAVLLSIESMYAELFALSSDEEREECIRDSFPNEQHLSQAMLALIQLLDPTIDTADPVIKDADVDSLIKVVLFEERHRAEQGPASLTEGASGLGRPNPPSKNLNSSVPPPLPRAADGRSRRTR